MRISDWSSDVCSSDLVAVADVPGLAVGAVGLEDERGLVASGGEMAVEAVHADVEFAVGEPADAEILGVEADVADAGGRRHPFQALRDAAPERIRVADEIGRASCRERVCQYV